MKKLLIGLALTLPYSTFASIYSGIDNNGDACSVEVSKVDNHRTLVKVVTKDLDSAVYTESQSLDDDRILFKTETWQDRQSGILRTTEYINLDSRNGSPYWARITIIRHVREKSWSSPYETVQESVCNI